jgi:hypothetical protein
MAPKNPTRTKASTHPLEDHPKYVEAIGMVALEAIALELRFAMLLGRLLAIPQRIARAIYLTPKSEQARLEILRNAAEARLASSPSKRDSPLGRQMSAALKRVIGLQKRALKLIGKRHGVIHDEWNYSPMKGEITRKAVDGKLTPKITKADLKELERLIDQMRDLIDDAYDLAEEFRKDPPFMVDLSIDTTKSG